MKQILSCISIRLIYRQSTVTANIKSMDVNKERRKVAVVTGGNKGIGFAIVRGLCKQFDGHVYLTARDVGRGKAAVVELEKEGITPHFHQLDIDDVGSIQGLRQFLMQNYGGLDVLVNNAAIVYKDNSTLPFVEQAEKMIATNYWGSLNVYNIMLPILRPHASDVRSGKYADEGWPRSTYYYVTKTGITAKMAEMSPEQSVDADQPKPDSAVSASYGISKIGVTLMTPLQQEMLDRDSSKRDIVVNSCSPGYIATGMTDFKGNKTIDEGADTPLYLALLPPNVETPRGKLIWNRAIEKY